MPTGCVKWFDERQGFGYIIPDEGGADVFVHASVLALDQAGGLPEGVAVRYEQEVGPRGPRALSVELKGFPDGDDRGRE